MAQTRCAMAGFLFLILSLTVWSLDTTPIDQVRVQYSESSSQPDAAAIQIINSFWQKSLDTIMLSEDTEEILSIRTELKKQKGTKELSYYATAYIKSAYSQLKIALDTVSKWQENEKMLPIERNLIILVYELNSVDLADLVIPKLQDADPMVRYWSVRALTSPSIISQLKSDVTGDEKKTAAIVSALKEYVQKFNDSQPQPCIAEFSAGMNTNTTLSILAAVTDKRIAAYMDWSVNDEVVDSRILKSIARLVIEEPSVTMKTELLGRFGQLYACVLMRYIQGNKTLPQTNIEQLITVIAEIEDFTINKMVASWNSKFRINLSKNQALNKEYELLFGSSGRPGELVTRMNFNFGKDSSGKPLLTPRPLGEPPVKSQASQSTQQ